MHTTPFAYKAPFGLAEDNIAYACMTRYASKHPQLYVPNGVVKENKNQRFAIGNVVILYQGILHRLLGDINLTYYIGGLLPIFIGVILIFKIIQLFFQQHAIPIAVGSSILIFCSNFNDFFGILQFLDGIFFQENYHGNYLVFGYSQRFTYAQSALPFFLFWIYRFLRYREESNFKNQALLILSLIGLQYAYFYYWTYAIPIVIASIIVEKKQWKEWKLLLLGYVVGSAHFWWQYYTFTQLDFYTEYQQKMQGVETFPLFWILIVGSLNILPFLRRTNKLLTAGIFSAPIGIYIMVEFIHYYGIPPSNFIYKSYSYILPFPLIIFGFLALKKKHWGPQAFLSLSNYFLIILLCCLKFIIGFNIQPFHWVYTAFYPLLIVSLISVWKNYIHSKHLKWTVISSSLIIIIIGITNSFKLAQFNYKFWTIHDDEIEVINHLKEHPYSVIAGNNMMPLITFLAHTDLYIYEGISCNNISTFDESAQRFIHPYKLMGYSNEGIIEEYKKYEQIPKYHQLYTKGNIFERDSLSKVYPDNILGSVEAMLHYFMSPSDYLSKFKQAISNYNNSTQFEMNKLIIYKPTFKGNYSKIKGLKVFENETFIIYNVSYPNTLKK